MPKRSKKTDPIGSGSIGHRDLSSHCNFQVLNEKDNDVSASTADDVSASTADDVSASTADDVLTPFSKTTVSTSLFCQTLKGYL